MSKNLQSYLKISYGIGKIIGIIGLLATYVHLFGLDSLKKYLGKDVIIITHEESPSSIFPPGYVSVVHSNTQNLYYFISTFSSAIQIVGQNPLTGVGWKTRDCKGEAGDNLIKCVEENTYSTSDIFISNHSTSKFKAINKRGEIDKFMAVDSNQSIEVRPFFMEHTFYIMAHLLYPSPGVISHQAVSTLQLYLNNSISYYFSIGDPKLIISTVRPDSVPIENEIIQEGTEMYFLFPKVSDQISILSNTFCLLHICLRSRPVDPDVVHCLSPH